MSISITNRSTGSGGTPTAINVPNVTDLASYTLTITGTISDPTPGTIVNDIAQWRQVGEFMEISYDFSQSSAGLSGSGTYLFNIPAGYAIDGTKTVISTNTTVDNQVGTFWGYAAGTLLSGAIMPYDTTHVAVYVTYIGGSAGGQVLGSGTGQLNLSDNQYGLIFRVPIVGFTAYTTYNLLT